MGSTTFDLADSWFRDLDRTGSNFTGRRHLAIPQVEFHGIVYLLTIER
jgi:hypothetical protein